MEIGPIRNQNFIPTEGQQKIKIVRTNRQSNLRGSCQSIFSLCWHHPNRGTTKKSKSSAPTDNQIYGLPSNQFSPSACTTLPTDNQIYWLPSTHFSPLACTTLFLHQMMLVASLQIYLYEIERVPCV